MLQGVLVLTSFAALALDMPGHGVLPALSTYEAALNACSAAGQARVRVVG